MGRSMLLYCNKGLLSYESTERMIKPGLQVLKWILMDTGLEPDFERL